MQMYTYFTMIFPLIVFLLATCISSITGRSIPVKRELTFEKMGGYQPQTDVRDQSLLDLDNALIEKLLAEGNASEALNIYNNGAFSRSYAVLQLGSEGLPANIPGHANVTGTSDSGGVIKGMTLVQGKQGDKALRVLYQNPDNPHPCYVGGNPQPVLDGCFTDSGHISLDHVKKAVPYTYDKVKNNMNDRALASFSTTANSRMRPCGKCEMYTVFFRFFQFYGKADYANQWVMAAFSSALTVFDTGKADFTGFSLEARSAAITKAIVTMMMVPYINLQMEVAAQQCKSTCPKGGCSSDPVNSVDIAAAFYIGSLENGSGSGKLMYSVADLECKEFKTCGITGDATTGTAKANIEILQDFLDMQTNLTAQACSVARSQKDHVMNRMNIPLIQGTLRYAYLRSKDKATEIDTAIGAAYAASIVPLVAGCSFQDAVIIHDNMETTATSTDFATVKEAFERHYACLGLTCKDIGGYWDRRSYFEGAAPCTFDVVKTESVPKKAIGWGVGVPLFLIAAGVLFCVCRRNSGKKSRNIDDFSDSSFDDDEDCSPII